jgi:hypothetical protein
MLPVDNRDSHANGGALTARSVPGIRSLSGLIGTFQDSDAATGRHGSVPASLIEQSLTG